MTTLAELILRADYSQMDRARGSVDSLAAAGGKTASVMRDLAAAVGVAFGTKEILDAANAYTKINNRLGLVTDSTEQLSSAYADLYAISQRTSSPLEATAELYQRIAQNAGALGISMAEVGRTTETINKLMIISGSSGEAAAAALTQLGQALASGALRGDELNSIMEQTPALAMAIADGMGITIGQLRTYGAEGKITSEVILSALEKQGAAVDDQFAKMQKTVPSAMTEIKNSFVNFVGRLDEATGSTNMLADALSGLSKIIDNSGAIASISGTFAQWGAASEHLRMSLSGAGDEAGGILAAFTEIASAGGDAFRDLPTNVKYMVQVATVYLADFVDKGVSGFTTLKEAAAAIFTSDTISAAMARGQARYKAYEDALTASLVAAEKERADEIAHGAIVKRRTELESLLVGLDDGSSNSGGGVKPTGNAEKEKQAKSIEIQAQGIQEKMQAEINAEMDRRAWLEEAFASEIEAESLRYKQKKALLDEYLINAQLSKEDARLKQEALEQEHSDRLTAIKEAESKKDKSILAQKLGQSQAFMSDLYARTGAHSNKMTRLIQSVGAAQALINTYIGASQTLADPTLPFWAKVGAVAKTIATGMGLVNAIKGGGASSGGGGGVSSSVPDSSGIVAQQSQPARSQTVDFRIQSRGIWRDEDVAELMQVIGDRVSDGAKFGRVEFMTT